MNFMLDFAKIRNISKLHILQVIIFLNLHNRKRKNSKNKAFLYLALNKSSNAFRGTTPLVTFKKIIIGLTESLIKIIISFARMILSRQKS